MKHTAIIAVLFAGGLLWSGADALGARPFAQAAASSTSASADRDATQKIRKALVADKNLSTYAHNVYIQARDGNVTLRGPVRSEDEKKAVVDAAAAVVGADHVVNQLTVQPPK